MKRSVLIKSFILFTVVLTIGFFMQSCTTPTTPTTDGIIPPIGEVAPQAPVVTEVEDGKTYINCTPVFTAPTGETYSAALSRDGGTAEAYTSGSKILKRGSYVLVVVATDTDNGLTSQTTINFIIDRNLDIDGDGHEDVVIGAPKTDNEGEDRGSAFVYYGAASSFTADSPLELDDPDGEDNALFGYSVESAGDVNGDGYDDVVIGAPYTDNDGTDWGSTFVYYGSASGLTAISPVELDDPDDEDSASFGYSVAGAGDVNGDGYEDVVIGAPWTDNDGLWRGSVFVYYGSAAGLITASPVELDDPDDQDNAFFGWSVSPAGDVNGDGYDDIVIGAYGTGNEGTYRGSAFVYYGSAAGLITASPVELDDPDDEDSAYFGWSVASAGDVNGDGYDDIVIGAPKTDNGGLDWGSAFVYYGSASGLTTASQVELDDPDNESYAYFGWSVASAGDVNGDGYDDMVSGAPGTDNDGISTGSAFVYYGTTSGLTTTSPTELKDPDNESYAYFGTIDKGFNW